MSSFSRSSASSCSPSVPAGGPPPPPAASRAPSPAPAPGSSAASWSRASSSSAARRPDSPRRRPSASASKKARSAISATARRSSAPAGCAPSPCPVAASRTGAGPRLPWRRPVARRPGACSSASSGGREGMASPSWPWSSQLCTSNSLGAARNSVARAAASAASMLPPGSSGCAGCCASGHALPVAFWAALRSAALSSTSQPAGAWASSPLVAAPAACAAFAVLGGPCMR